MKDIKILINEGKATLSFKEGGSINREDIENVVEEGGFTPRSIDIREK